MKHFMIILSLVFSITAFALDGQSGLEVGVKRIDLLEGNGDKLATRDTENITAIEATIRLGIINRFMEATAGFGMEFIKDAILEDDICDSSDDQEECRRTLYHMMFDGELLIGPEVFRAGVTAETDFFGDNQGVGPVFVFTPIVNDDNRIGFVYKNIIQNTDDGEFNNKHFFGIRGSIGRGQ